MRRLTAALLFVVVGCASGHSMHVTGCSGAPLPMRLFDRDDGAHSPAAAVLLTGDGGWRRIDADIARVLRAHGITVAGFLSNRYFARERTREEVTCDLRRAIAATVDRTGASTLVLIGFSRGADTLAVAAPALVKQDGSRVALVAMLAPATTASLRIDRWWRRDAAPFAIDPRPLTTAPTLCVYGVEDRDSLCPLLPEPATIVARPGGHHFDGNYRAIAEIILGRLQPLP